MKQLSLSLMTLLVFSLAIVSCDKENKDVNPSGVNNNSSNIVTEYCDEVDQWAMANYPDATIDSVILITANIQGTDIEVYELYLSNGVIAQFNVDPVFGLDVCTLINETGLCGCPIIFDPVCWNDNDYDSECLAICDGATAGDPVAGTCDPCSSCSTIIDPVCVNGTTYDNECLALCNGENSTDILMGACGPCGCPTNYDPVCVDGTTYDNECLAICEGAAQSDIVPGVCPANGTCDVGNLFPTATVLNVLEGYENVGYGNANYAVTLDFDGTTITVYFDESCNYYTFCGCDATLDIVCAGGVSYINTCHAECDGFSSGDITPGPC